MDYTQEILKRVLQELKDKKEYFYSDKIDYDNDLWRKGIDKCDEEIKVVNNLLRLFSSKTLSMPDVSKSLHPKYCDQCGEPLGMPHKFWCVFRHQK